MKAIHLNIPPEIANAKKHQLKALAKKYYQENSKRSVVNESTKLVIGFSKIGVNKSIHGQSISKEYLVLLKNLKTILKYSEYNNFSDKIKPSHKKKNIIGFFNLLVKVSIDGKQSRWRISVALHKGGSFKFHYATNPIKKFRKR